MSNISEEIHEFHPIPPAPMTDHNVPITTQEEIYKTKTAKTLDIIDSTKKEEEPKKEIQSKSSI